MTKCAVLIGVFNIVVQSITSITDLSINCPYTDYCSIKSSNTTAKEDSCCRPCSCSNLCGLIDACCPDKETTQDSYNSYQCLPQEKIINDYLNITSGDSNISRGYLFRIVTKCHARNLRLTNINELINKCSKAERLENLNFVTSITSGVTYLNKYCALCNGETEYRNWDLHVTREEGFKDIHSFEARDKYLLANGNVLNFPSTEDDLRLALCYTPVISRCNETLLWNFYDWKLERKCLQYNNIYYKSTKTHLFRKYKNIFCYLCNMPYSTKVEHNCKNIVKTSYSSTMAKKMTSHFTALLVIGNEKRESKHKRTEEVCNQTEVIEPFKNRCIRLMCPPGFYHMNGGCEMLYENVNGFTVKYFFRLTFSKEVQLPWINMELVLNELVSYMIHFINDNETSCKTCGANIVTLPVDRLAFRIYIRSSVYCSYLHYIERVSQMFRSSPFVVHSNTYDMDIILNGLYDDGLNITENKAGPPYLNVDCNTPVPYTKSLVHCPSINLVESDISSHRINPQLQKEIINNSSKIGNNTIRICYSDYIRIFDKATASASIVFYDGCLIFTMMTIFLVTFKK